MKDGRIKIVVDMRVIGHHRVCMHSVSARKLYIKKIIVDTKTEIQSLRVLVNCFLFID